MFALAPLGDLSRFRRSDIKSEVYLVTEDVCIKSHGILLAARSAKLEKMVEESENIPAVEFSDDIAGLEDCLDLVYGGSVDIREENCKSICKFGKLFQIMEMMDGVLSWIAVHVTYDKFWKVYLELKNLHDDMSVFVDILKGYFSADGDNFIEHSVELCSSKDDNTTTAVVELLSRIDDIRVLPVMENIIDTAIQNNDTLSATSSMNTNNYLQTVVSSTITYIEKFLKSDSRDKSHKSRCKQTLQKVSSVCTNIETFRTITRISLDISNHPYSSGTFSFTAHSVKDLNWERVKQLTSPTTSYDVIKYFAENAGIRIHPCVVVEIVLKWWSVRTDREQVDTSFVKPLITPIQNVNSGWYYSVCEDERYKSLTKKRKFTPTPKNDPTTDIASHIQPAVKHLPDGIQSSIAHDVTHLLHSPPTAKSNLQPHLQLALKNLKTKTQRLKILPADKGNSIVILTHKQYHDKVQQHIDEGPYTELSKDPTSTLPSKLDRILKRLLTDNKITKSFYDSCRNLHPRSPQLYGTPKLHKVNCPIRPHSFIL